ncbi:glycosyltransferase family 2 protein [Sphingomonas sp.]|uniref:glycosyltransferase family 2 protein n=1 Tax=Sphingomonas sp. TaxID=28214 RepID=UPI0035BC6FFE
MTKQPPPDFLPLRNALADWAHVESEEVFAGRDAGIAPVLSITIPTYRRSDVLAEAVASALAQDLGQPFEVVIVDNDPESLGHEALLAAIPALAEGNVRYLRNRENIGMYGNINRCVEVARGAWISILHDDDMIDPDFARRTLAELTSPHARFDGLVSRKRLLDQREVRFTRGRIKGAIYRAREAYQFGGRGSRRIDARQLFWGCVVGNTVGFICRTADIRALGGFYPEEHPSCDYFFYARFAERWRLGESRQVLATIRVAVNSLTQKAQQLACLRQGYELQCAYAGSVLPRFWARLSPLVMARQVAVTSAFWRSGITKAEAEEAIGVAMPRDRPLALYLMRLALRGF